MLEEKILETIKRYNLIETGDNVVIGVSGGPDSICLLHVLNKLKKKLNFKIYVAHVNHMIREEAIKETEYVKEFCKSIGIKCYVKTVDVKEHAKIQKKGTEETGREIRYKFFDEVLEETSSNKIATAHNNNDKIETIIMNILRGSGTSGLKGIEAKRNNKYIRPLIETERQEIEEYCILNKLNPKYDKSNEENIYTRNKIRNLVIPYIKKEFNPNILRTLNRLSEVTTEENDYLEKVTGQAFKEALISDIIQEELLLENNIQRNVNQIVLDLKEFNNLELVIRRRLILYTIRELIGTTQGIEKVNIEDIIELCSNNIGNKYLTPIKNIKILVKNKKIFFIPNKELP